MAPYLTPHLCQTSLFFCFPSLPNLLESHKFLFTLQDHNQLFFFWLKWSILYHLKCDLNIFILFIIFVLFRGHPKAVVMEYGVCPNDSQSARLKVQSKGLMMWYSLDVVPGCDLGRVQCSGISRVLPDCTQETIQCQRLNQGYVHIRHAPQSLHPLPNPILKMFIRSVHFVVHFVSSRITFG